MFAGERIYLRKLKEQDAHLYHIWRNDPEVMGQTSMEVDLHTIEGTKKFISTIMTESKSYIIAIKEDDRSIGVISLSHIDLKNRNSELIIDIDEKSEWGKGYGKEAIRLLISYSFSELNLHKVNFRVLSSNDRAIRLYENIGFIKEGEQKEQVYRKGTWHGIVHMAVFQNDG